jgi:hypothetical protein
MWFNDYDYNYIEHDCGEDLRNETWWNAQQNNSVWFNASTPEMYYIWNNWNDYHYGTGEMDEHVDDLSEWLWEDLFETGDDYHLHENPACGVDDSIYMFFECKEATQVEYDICWVYFEYDPCNMATMDVSSSY